MPKIVAEDDVIIRASQVILDPDTDPERYAAIADYYHVDVPDFDGWVDRVRASIPNLYPATFQMVDSQDALRNAIGDADGIICESLLIGEEELAAAPALKVIQKFGTDTRNIDLDACARHGVAVRPLRRRVNIAVAEHAFTCLLAMAKKLCLINHRIDEDSLRAAGFQPRMHDRRHAAAANWGRVNGLGTIYGATVGCLGLGEIGREVAARATAFGANVLYYQRTRLPEDIERPLGATYCGLNELLERSDFVSVHLPMNDSTRGLIDADAFARMKDGTFLVNISRAPIIDRAALMDVLESDRLGGIALDVHYEEPSPPDDPLKKYPKALLTPHSAVAGRANATADMEELIANLAAGIG
jgi:phosphoglycerate dehydrogenase-like enzyme